MELSTAAALFIALLFSASLFLNFLFTFLVVACLVLSYFLVFSLVALPFFLLPQINNFIWNVFSTTPTEIILQTLEAAADRVHYDVIVGQDVRAPKTLRLWHLVVEHLRKKPEIRDAIARTFRRPISSNILTVDILIKSLVDDQPKLALYLFDPTQALDPTWPVLGMSSKVNPNFIFLCRSLYIALENATDSNLDTRLSFLVYITLLHECCHLMGARSGVDSANLTPYSEHLDFCTVDFHYELGFCFEGQLLSGIVRIFVGVSEESFGHGWRTWIDRGLHRMGLAVVLAGVVNNGTTRFEDVIVVAVDCYSKPDPIIEISRKKLSLKSMRRILASDSVQTGPIELVALKLDEKGRYTTRTRGWTGCTAY